MPRPSDSELTSGLEALLGDWAERGAAKGKADAANDAAILTGIKRLIDMQAGDTDSPSDAKVLAALKTALAAQEADIREG